jgi:hypothetical protein
MSVNDPKRTFDISMSSRLRVVTGLVIAALVGCVSSVLPEQNFRDHMNANIGKRIDDPRTQWINASVLVASRELRNGNVENEYRWRDTCHYFFEYEKTSKRILAWRYSGDEKDCAIVP